MNKTAIGLFITIFAGMLLLGFIAPIFADIPPDVNSHWASTPPTINGILAPGEWSNAAVVPFTMQMRGRLLPYSVIKTLDGTFFVMNNASYLFIAVQIYNVWFLTADFNSNFTLFSVLFSNNDNNVLFTGDQGEGVHTWIGDPMYTNNDLFYNATISYWDYDTDPFTGAHGTNNGLFAWTHTNPIHGQIGDYTFEMAIPLASPDIGYDFNIASLPSTVGFKIWFAEPANSIDGVFPDNMVQARSNDQIYNASSYGDLIIHPPYYLTVITTPGGNTNPAPGIYGPYSYGDVVPVQATANPGYTFGHWELDTVNVGPTPNPYQVTMNQNHTIKAVFKQISAAPTVGGLSFYSLAPKAPTPIIAYGALFGLATVTIVVTRRRKK
jgi:hypothetical protein